MLEPMARAGIRDRHHRAGPCRCPPGGLSAPCRVQIVPDGAETAADVRAGRRRLLAARAGLGPGTLAASAGLRSGRRRSRTRRPSPEPRSSPAGGWSASPGSSGSATSAPAAALRPRQPRRHRGTSSSSRPANRPLSAASLRAVERRRGERLRFAAESGSCRSRPSTGPGSRVGSAATYDDRDWRSFPTLRDEFSICKSANRVVLALTARYSRWSRRRVSTPSSPCTAASPSTTFERGSSDTLDDPSWREPTSGSGRSIIERGSPATAVERRSARRPDAHGRRRMTEQAGAHRLCPTQRSSTSPWSRIPRLTALRVPRLEAVSAQRLRGTGSTASPIGGAPTPVHPVDAHPRPATLESELDKIYFAGYGPRGSRRVPAASRPRLLRQA